jgi:hypothetical protein
VLPVGVGSPVGFLPADIGVSLCTTDSLVRFSEVAPICAPLLRSTPLASTHRSGYEQNHEDDRDRDDDNDDAGAHPACPLNRPKRDDTKVSERRGYATGANSGRRRRGGRSQRRRLVGVCWRSAAPICRALNLSRIGTILGQNDAPGSLLRSPPGLARNLP